MNTKNINLEFHIESDDYFGTLAAILDLFTQSVMGSSDKDKILKEKVKELMYLQNNYKIIKKDGSKSSNKEYRQIHS